MPEVLDRLEREHANFAALLEVLEHQLAVFAQAGPVDYAIILDIIDYFLDYPDLVHHPNEDLIYQKLRERAPELAAQIDDLEVEHHKIGELTRAFAETVRGVLLEFDISRDNVLSAAKDFIENQNHHMEMERTVFFPAARQALSEADWAAIDAAAQARTDPLFNGGATERYEALRQDIMRWKNMV